MAAASASTSAAAIAPEAFHPDVTVAAAEEPQRSAEVLRASRAVVPGWQELADDQIEVSIIHGGITNSLFRVECAADSAAGRDPHVPTTVVVRVYGPDTDLVINRGMEKVINRIANAAGLGKPTLGEFVGGRVEGWLPGRPLTQEDFADAKVGALVARKLAEMHQVEAKELEKRSALWETLSDWFAKASAVEFAGHPEKQRAFEALDLAQFEVEIADLKRALKDVESPLVFAHNDLLSGNVILDEDAHAVNFIDMEYGCFNPRGFDLGNHFNEWCGFDCDWRRFPDHETRLRWVRAYLSELDGVLEADVAAERVLAVSSEAVCYALASHLFWGIWGVLQARYSPIEFDYLDYAKQRLHGGYLGYKDEYLAHAAAEAPAAGAAAAAAPAGSEPAAAPQGE